MDALSVDLIFHLLSYLPFEDIINISKLNCKLYSYCSDPQYKNRWKTIIDNIYGSVYNYEDKLNKIWSKLNVDNTYNYLVYIKLINLLDHLTQLMIYYRQGDTKSFNNNRFNDDQRFYSNERFLTMFLLNKPEEMKKYDPGFVIEHYFFLLEGKFPSIDDLNQMLFEMAEYGNIKGIKYMTEKGADIHYHNNFALDTSMQEGYLDVVKYIIEQHIDNIWKPDIYKTLSAGFKYACYGGHLDVVKYLGEKGIRNRNASKYAYKNKHYDVIDYLGYLEYLEYDNL